MNPRIIRTRFVALAPGWWRARLTWSDGIETEGYGLTLLDAEMNAVSPLPSYLTIENVEAHAAISRRDADFVEGLHKAILEAHGLPLHVILAIGPRGE